MEDEDGSGQIDPLRIFGSPRLDRGAGPWLALWLALTCPLAGLALD